MTPARLTIVIPSLNGATTIGYTLRSLQTQTVLDFETIVVDDGSSDATAEVARSFPGVTVMSHASPHGVSASRNDGAAVASGTWLCFLDDDDWFPKTFVEEALARVTSGEVLCYDNVLVVAEAGDEDTAVVLGSVVAKSAFSHRRVDRSALRDCFDDMPMLKSIVERAAFDRVGGFDARYVVGEDFQFHMKLVVAGYILDLTDEPHAFYRRRVDSVTARMSRRGIGLRVLAAQRWVRMATDMLAELDLPPDARRALERDLLDSWRYRLVTATIRSVFEGDRSRLALDAIPHFPGALKHGLTVRWPHAIAVRLRLTSGSKRTSPALPTK